MPTPRSSAATWVLRDLGVYGALPDSGSAQVARRRYEPGSGVGFTVNLVTHTVLSYLYWFMIFW
jgi:hypothetical protein